MLGIDTDNDSVFINQTIVDYCDERGLARTRSRPQRKNDQAWVAQKNGAVVRKPVAYERLTVLMQCMLWRSSAQLPECTPSTFSRRSSCDQRVLTLVKN
jgi:hypothetical protein